MTDAELCREVAVKVMGWRYDKRNPNKPIVPNASDPNWAHFEDFELSWSDAGRVVERMHSLGFAPFDCYSPYRDSWHVVFSWEACEHSSITMGVASTFPRAVFEAALKAVEARDAHMAHAIEEEQV